ncbi:MAG: hypothetical protein SGJ17_01915 [Hyphomicrobiales bacterium]|nr:hypothetical protein [Hyphomicrobiales bacterium]
MAAHGHGVFSVLAQYRRDDAVAAWHETIRAVEEFINLPRFGIADDRLRAWLCAIRFYGAFVSNSGLIWLAVRQALASHLEPSVIGRFTRIMLYAGAMSVAFAAHGQDARSASITLDTIGGAVDYFQSRRRHLVSLLYTMPHACSGSLVLQPYDALTSFCPTSSIAASPSPAFTTSLSCSRRCRISAWGSTASAQWPAKTLRPWTTIS